ncbi:glycosyltransferase [Pelagicoccus sp. SDUM812005]|uniref:glycosyltransferase n=1 Tax=Pelagicoccus sp. SDUM812005 TaxID=3041257 RepID=UPI0028105E44|nr:glycosyltransferase [Pelagicoccus sp. SDUM812005]MDQ8183734.1 glycosyltransferase [Pelagicoccus sp. SDUM812005]
MTNILFLAHHFPPQGGAGVQRALKFVKYLPAFGVSPAVLTASHLKQDRWTPKDDTMEKEIPDSASVHRVDWPDYRNAAGTDLAQAQEKLIETGVRIAQEKRVKAILVSMSPFEDAHLAREIATRTGLPWIADLRDPWALDEFQVHRTGLHRALARKRMGRSLEGAASIIMNTPEAAKRLRAAFPLLRQTQIHSITNGYDQEDFLPQASEASRDKFTIVHAGFLHTRFGFDQRRKSLRYQLLRSTHPGMQALSRSHYYLLQALANWAQEHPAEANRVELVLAGSLNETDTRTVEDSRVKELVRCPGYLNHQESVSCIAHADLLFLPMHTLARGDRATFVPGKTYEYMATGNPILAAVPEGDARDFLAASGLARICEPNDAKAIQQHLRASYLSWERAEPRPEPDHKFIAQFERQHLTEKLASVLLDVTHRNREPSANSKAAPLTT